MQGNVSGGVNRGPANPKAMTTNHSRTIALRGCLALLLALLPTGCLTPGPGDSSAGSLSSSDRARMDSSATSALRVLYSGNSAARELGRKAQAVLVFPDVVKGGFMIGGQIGNGVLRRNGRTIGYYNLTAASYGFQAGLQSFGYALFLMNDSAMDYLNKSAGWEVGVGPSLVIVDEGMAKTMTSTTLRDDVYALVFGQRGLMAGAGLQGSKITRIDQ
jgi:lipid-binding SYLF domain-containing protein